MADVTQLLNFRMSTIDEVELLMKRGIVHLYMYQELFKRLCILSLSRSFVRNKSVFICSTPERHTFLVRDGSERPVCPMQCAYILKLFYESISDRW